MSATSATTPVPAPSARTRLKRIRFHLVVVFFSVVAAEAMHRSGTLAPIEHLYSDFWHRASGLRFAPEHVAIVVVDDATLAEHGDIPMVFWTPLFARAAATLRDVGATVVGVDFLFAITPEDWISKLQLSATDVLRDYDLAFRQELSRGQTVVVGAAVRGTAGQDDGVLLPHTDYLLSLPNTDVISHVGLADLVTDSDGGVRNYQIAPALKLPADIAESAPRFTLAALLTARAAHLDTKAGAWTVGGRTVNVHEMSPITYAGPAGSVPRVSLSKVLAEGAVNDPDVRALRGKVVIIGADYLGMNDLHTTPYSSRLFRGATDLMAGVEIQANIVETLLSGKETRPLPGWILVVILTAMIGLTSWAYRQRTPWTSLIQLSVVLAISAIVAFAMFQRFWLVPAAAIQFGLLTAYLLAFGERLTHEERDKERVKKMFKGYVSDSVVDMLLSSERKVDLDGQSMNITVLFTDIRRFTTISEKMSAQEVVEFLNAYFARVVHVVTEEGGHIDKFIGDAVMAEFGVPYPFPDHAHRALRAAVRIRAVAQEFQGWMKAYADRGVPPFEIGIGVHTGDAVVGNIGSKAKMEYTAVGDTVNVASRLEGETKGLNCVIAASGETLRAAGDRVETGIHRSINVRGRLEPLEVYEIIDVRS